MSHCRVFLLGLVSSGGCLVAQPVVAQPTPNAPAPATEDFSRTSGDLQPEAEPFTVPTQTEAVETQKVLPLSLAQAIAIALKNNPDYRIQALTLAQSQAALREAQAALYPTLSFTGEFIRAKDASTQLTINAEQAEFRGDIRTTRAEILALRQELAALGNPTTVDQRIQQALLVYELEVAESSLLSDIASLRTTRNYATSELTGTVTLNYTLFDAQRSPQIRAAERTVAIQQLQLAAQRQQVILDTQLAYYNLQAADQQVQTDQAAVTESQKSVTDAQALASGGLATRLDVLNAQVQLDNAQQQLLRSQAQQRIARQQLAQQLALPLTVEPQASDPVALAGQWSLSLTDSLRLAFQQRTELAVQRLTRDRAAANRRAALGALWPQLSLFADYELLQLYTDSPSDTAARGFATGYAVGVTLQWDLFDGGAAAAQARQQALNMDIAAEQFRQLKQQIRFEVTQHYTNLQTNQQAYEIAVTALKRAEQALQFSRVRFQAGVGTQTDVLRAESNLTQARNNLTQAIVAYNQALANLRRAVSQPAEAPRATP